MNTPNLPLPTLRQILVCRTVWKIQVACSTNLHNKKIKNEIQICYSIDNDILDMPQSILQAYS